MNDGSDVALQQRDQRPKSLKRNQILCGSEPKDGKWRRLQFRSIRDPLSRLLEFQNVGRLVAGHRLVEGLDGAAEAFRQRLKIVTVADGQR